jgi:2-keto-4-pentenoate hydratase/2-oxohepta-3-ene-1,7-dioic acid hydratase in catechol pathway
MRLVSYDAGDGARAGVLEDKRVVDAWAALGEPERGSLRELIADGRLSDLGKALEGGKGSAGEKDTGASLPLDEVELLPPIPDPEKIVCIGLNYRSHAAEAGIEAPQSPAIFGKFRNALAAPGATVRLPAASQKVDFEAELAFVVGRTASEVSEEEALEYVAGYTLLNDLSARDLQFATPQWMSGKVFDGSAPCGPAERRGDAERLHRRPDLQRAAAALPPLQPDDAGAGRHRLDRDPGWCRQRARAAGLVARRRRDRHRLSDHRHADDPDRLLIGPFRIVKYG